MQNPQAQNVNTDLGAKHGQQRRRLPARLLPVVLIGSLALLTWRYAAPPAALAGTNVNSSCSDWDGAFEQSQATGKPALVVFTADWCPTCRRFGQEALADARVQKYLQDNHTLIVCNLSDTSSTANAARAQQLGVSSVPMLILFDQTGHEKARALGMPASSLLTWLRSGGTEISSVYDR